MEDNFRKLYFFPALVLQIILSSYRSKKWYHGYCHVQRDQFHTTHFLLCTHSSFSFLFCTEPQTCDILWRLRDVINIHGKILNKQDCVHMAYLLWLMDTHVTVFASLCSFLHLWSNTALHRCTLHTVIGKDSNRWRLVCTLHYQHVVQSNSVFSSMCHVMPTLLLRGGNRSGGTRPGT